ncbi:MULTISPECIES: cytochrome P450 [Mycobacterium]|uniref:Cytochrome n=1 Tax=Mycobacterium colombiense TaxID=339268 RepID=A0A1A0VTI7_9MYCO|nr:MULTISPECIES: cytochrome P450 [Mycobacterium]OBB86595.1 cytochrome [Mycobacterium colombiense]OBB98687.1 cytochrome [Mycobacterium sp. 852002-40037_SCH5390672]
MLSNEIIALDPKRLKELFDLRSEVYEMRGGSFEDDPYPAFNELRESGPVHAGTPGELVGYDGPAFFSGLPFDERPHFTAFDYATCSEMLQDPETFAASQHEPGSAEYESQALLLFMDGQRHRRLRSLVRNAFTPKRAGWWVDNWIDDIVEALFNLIARKGKSDLNVEFFAPIPLLTICSSFGVSVEEALQVRAAIVSDAAGITAIAEIVKPIVEARRLDPRDDLISMLVSEEFQDEDGSRHHLSDAEVQMFSLLLLAAGSGTTWKQLGITMLTLLQRPEWLSRVVADPGLVHPFVEETLRWMPTDPAFGRFARCDTTLGGVRIPKGAVVHACFAAANRDPLRWDRPDEFLPDRPIQPNLGFGRGTHVCLGQHVARAEISAAITALTQRLPGLRLDPDAETPRIIGMYERGVTSVPVVWDLPGVPQ